MKARETLALLIIIVARGRSIADDINLISSLGDSDVLHCPSSHTFSTCPSSFILFMDRTC